MLQKIKISCVSPALIAKLILDINNKELAFKKYSWGRFMLNKFFDQSMKLFVKMKLILNSDE